MVVALQLLRNGGCFGTSIKLGHKVNVFFLRGCNVRKDFTIYMIIIPAISTVEVSNLLKTELFMLQE